MPVYKEVATSQRELRVQPSYAPPLPDLGPGESALREADKFDVIVVGAGPSGLLATLLLSRYGLSDARLLCIDSKPESLRSGQADGIQPRTIEVLASLGLQHEIIEQACHFWEISFWDSDGRGGVRRTAYAPDVDVPSRFPHESTIHQGRIERILDDDLKRYSTCGVERSTTLTSLEIDLDGDREYPVFVEVEKGRDDSETQNLTPGKHKLRCKYLIGADGGHSITRKVVGLPLIGESREHIWGVMDFIADTKFPDIRRKSMVQSDTGSCMIIPRERIATGDHLTRLYVHMDEMESETKFSDHSSIEEAKMIARRKREQVTAERILARADQALRPYGIKMKHGTQPDWWAAYEIGQRVSDKFIRKDTSGEPRVFLAGDACHTHSPKAGQGMNVSLMDSFNLSWKLAHVLFGITPPSRSRELLESYDLERRQVARDLIEYDAALSTAFSSKGQDGKESSNAMKADQLDEIWRMGHGFTSGCGIEYQENGLVQQNVGEHVKGVSYLEGIIRPGRRLLNVRVQRHTDGRPANLHDDLPSFGCFTILVMTSTDLLNLSGKSAGAVAALGSLIDKYTRRLLHPIVLHSLDEDIRGIDWDLLPPGIFQNVEMNFYSTKPGVSPLGKKGGVWGSQMVTDDTYSIYGVNRTQGAIVILRPDQVVGMVAGLDEAGKVQNYLDKWLPGNHVAS